MAFVCPENSERRQGLLTQLKCLVNELGSSPCPCPPSPHCCPEPCCPPMCCPMMPPGFSPPPGYCPPACCQPCVQPCDEGPVIEIYDPLPKACVPVCSPPCCSPPPCCPMQCCPPSPCSPMIPVCTGPMSPPCCPSPCCQPQCCSPPPMCGPCGEVTSCPVPVCVPRCPIVLPPCMPITYPVNPPCVPICNPHPEEQPCVPCNPPQMMVCYRRTQNGGDGGANVKRSKSRELRASILYVGCDCIKRNGLQDDCPRSECQGAPACLTKPEPTCGPAEAARRMYLQKDYFGRKNGGSNGLEEYQCYPAYVKIPGMSCGGGQSCGPCPGVPIMAQTPCPPTICPGPPPLIPVGTMMPISSPCCPPQCCTPQCCPPQCCPCPC